MTPAQQVQANAPAYWRKPEDTMGTVETEGSQGHGRNEWYGAGASRPFHHAQTATRTLTPVLISRISIHHPPHSLVLWFYRLSLFTCSTTLSGTLLFYRCLLRDFTPSRISRIRLSPGFLDVPFRFLRRQKQPTPGTTISFRCSSTNYRAFWCKFVHRT